MIITFKNTIKNSDVLWRFMLHVFTGVICVSIHYALMSLMLFIGISALFSSSIGFCFGAFTRFMTAYYHVFEPSKSVQETIPKFVFSLIMQGILNFFLLYLLMSMQIKVWAAQILTTVSMTFLNFIIYRIWVFK